MTDISGEVLNYLKGKNPDEIRRTLARLAREAQEDAEMRQEDSHNRLASLSVEDLEEVCQRERARNIHSQDYKDAYAALRNAWAAQDAARVKPAPPPEEEPPPPPPPRPDPRKKWYQLSGPEIDAKLGWESGRYSKPAPAAPESEE